MGEIVVGGVLDVVRAGRTTDGPDNRSFDRARFFVGMDFRLKASDAVCVRSIGLFFSFSFLVGRAFDPRYFVGRHQQPLRRGDANPSSRTNRRCRRFNHHAF